MKVLVSDTSVLIDLDRGSLVEPTFRLPFEFTVPDLLYERELKDHGGPDFMQRRRVWSDTRHCEPTAPHRGPGAVRRPTPDSRHPERLLEVVELVGRSLELVPAK